MKGVSAAIWMKRGGVTFSSSVIGSFEYCADWRTIMAWRGQFCWELEGSVFG